MKEKGDDFVDRNKVQLNPLQFFLFLNAGNKKEQNCGICEIKRKDKRTIKLEELNVHNDKMQAEPRSV